MVATVPNLQGTTIEDYANRLFRDWKLGQAKTNNGVLLLVAPSERKVRIEVGYGLEGALTDALSRVIIASAITPRFKTGDYFGGLDAGVDGILSILSGDAQEWQRKPQVRADEVDPAQVAIFIVLFLIVLFVAWRMSRGGSGRDAAAASSSCRVPARAAGAAASRTAGRRGASAAGSPAAAARRAAEEPPVTGRRADVLTPEARARLARAMARAEAGTSGEIVVMVSRRAGAYRSIVLLAALVAALILPWPLIALTAWSAASILLAQAALVAAILAASQNERLRLALVPRTLRSARAREAAQRAFWSRGLSLTRRPHRRAPLPVARRAARRDRHRSRRPAGIPPAAWDGILADLVQALGPRRGRGGPDGGGRAGRRLSGGTPPRRSRAIPTSCRTG